MTWLCVMAVLAAAPETVEPPAEAPAAEAPAKKPEKKKELKLGAPTFASANVTPEVTNVASEHFAQQLSLQGLRVITNSEIAALLGMERQKALLGCADDTSCMVELSNALGVDGVVTGSLGSFGGRYTVNVKVVGAADGRQLGVFSATSESERGLPDVLSRAAQDIAKQVKVALGWEEAPKAVIVNQAAPQTWAFSNRQKWALVPGILSVVLFVAGGMAFGQADYRHQSLLDRSWPDLESNEAFRFKSDGEAFRLWGWVGMGAGAACIAGAAWLFFWGIEAPAVTPAVAVGPDGVSLGVEGRLPW